MSCSRLAKRSKAECERVDTSEYGGTYKCPNCAAPIRVTARARLLFYVCNACGAQGAMSIPKPSPPPKLL